MVCVAVWPAVVRIIGRNIKIDFIRLTFGKTNFRWVLYSTVSLFFSFSFKNCFFFFFLNIGVDLSVTQFCLKSLILAIYRYSFLPFPFLADKLSPGFCLKKKKKKPENEHVSKNKIKVRAKCLFCSVFFPNFTMFPITFIRYIDSIGTFFSYILSV